MDYIKELDKNNVGLKTTLKKIFKDIDKRLKETSDDETSNDDSDGEKIGTKEIVMFYNDDGWNLYNTNFDIQGVVYDSDPDDPVEIGDLDWEVTFQDGSKKSGTTSTPEGEFSFEFMCDVLGSATLTISFKGDETYAPYTTGHTFDIVEQDPYIKPDGE